MGALPGCKSSRELVTVSEVKRNCIRATECEGESWIISCLPMNKIRTEGGADQGERAYGREAFTAKGQVT